MGRLIEVPLRIWEFIFVVIIMGLTGNIIASAVAGNPSSINYAMFCATWGTLVVLAGLVDSWAKPGFLAFIMFPLDVLTTLFFLCEGIALAALLHVHSCSNRAYTTTNEITDGAHDTDKRCRESQAITAFFWFSFALFAVSSIFTGRSFFSGGRPSIRRGPAPAMRQV